MLLLQNVLSHIFTLPVKNTYMLTSYAANLSGYLASAVQRSHIACVLPSCVTKYKQVFTGLRFSIEKKKRTISKSCNM